MQSEHSTTNFPSGFEHLLITLIITWFFVGKVSYRYIDSQITICHKNHFKSDYSISLAFWKES